MGNTATVFGKGYDRVLAVHGVGHWVWEGVLPQNSKVAIIPKTIPHSMFRTSILTIPAPRNNPGHLFFHKKTILSIQQSQW